VAVEDEAHGSSGSGALCSFIAVGLGHVGIQVNNKVKLHGRSIILILRKEQFFRNGEWKKRGIVENYMHDRDI